MAITCFPVSCRICANHGALLLALSKALFLAYLNLVIMPSQPPDQLLVDSLFGGNVHLSVLTIRTPTTLSELTFQSSPFL